MTRRRWTAAAALLGALVTTAVLMTTVQAQQPTPQQLEQAKAYQERMYKELGITAAQKNKMAAIDKKYVPQIQKLQKQMQTLVQQAQKETMAVLTPAQRSKLQQMRAQAQQQRR